MNIAPLQPNGKPVKVELNSGDKVGPYASRIRPCPEMAQLPTAIFVSLDSTTALILLYRCHRTCSSTRRFAT